MREERGEKVDHQKKKGPQIPDDIQPKMKQVNGKDQEPFPSQEEIDMD